MKHTAVASPKRPIAALGVAAALALALTGCLPGAGPAKSSDSAPPAPQSSAAADGSTTSAERGGGDASASASAVPASDAAKPAAAGKLTEPGTKLKLGEVAYTHSNSGKSGDADYKEATYETKVTKIVQGSEADLAKFKDAAKFAGQVPYYVFTDLVLTSLNKPSAGISDPRVQGHLKDGTEAQKLIVFGSMDQCDSTDFDTEGDGDAFSYVVGSTKTTCSVFLAPAGDAVTSASYDDSSFSYASYKDNKFRDNPVTWTD